MACSLHVAWVPHGALDLVLSVTPCKCLEQNTGPVASRCTMHGRPTGPYPTPSSTSSSSCSSEPGELRASAMGLASVCSEMWAVGYVCQGSGCFLGRWPDPPPPAGFHFPFPAAG